jgi:hypothetical protein
MRHNVNGLLLCCDSIVSSPELKPNKIADDEVNNKYRIEIRLRDITDSFTNTDCCSVRRHSKPIVGCSAI